LQTDKVAGAVVARGLPQVLSSWAAGEAPREWPRTQKRHLEAARKGRALELAMGLCVLVAFIAAALRATPAQSAVFALALLFVALQLDDYYWVALCLLPLSIVATDRSAARVPGPLLAVVALSAAMWALRAWVEPSSLAMPSGAGQGLVPLSDRQQAAANAVRSVLYSSALLGIFMTWLTLAFRRGVPTFSGAEE